MRYAIMLSITMKIAETHNHIEGRFCINQENGKEGLDMSAHYSTDLKIMRTILSKRSLHQLAKQH